MIWPNGPGPTRRRWPACCATWSSTGCSPSRARDSSRPTRPPRCCAPASPVRCGWTWTGSAAGWTWPSPAWPTPCARASQPGAGLRPAVLGLPGRQPRDQRLLRRDHGGGRRATPRWQTATTGRTVRHVADIGGGTGTLIAEVLGRHPRLHGTLADLPETRRPSPAVPGRARPGQPVRGRRPELLRPAAPGGGRLPARTGSSMIADDTAATAILRRCAEAAAAPAGCWWSNRTAPTAATPPRSLR